MRKSAHKTLARIRPYNDIPNLQLQGTKFSSERVFKKLSVSVRSEKGASTKRRLFPIFWILNCCHRTSPRLCFSWSGCQHFPSFCFIYFTRVNRASLMNNAPQIQECGEVQTSGRGCPVSNLKCINVPHSVGLKTFEQVANAVIFYHFARILPHKSTTLPNVGKF